MQKQTHKHSLAARGFILSHNGLDWCIAEELECQFIKPFFLHDLALSDDAVYVVLDIDVSSAQAIRASAGRQVYAGPRA